MTVGTVYFRSAIPGVSPQDAPDPESFARAQKGQWGAVIERGDEIVAITDGPRSYPLLFTEDALASHPAALGLRALNTDAAAEFRHLGFVSGTDTLLEGVRSVPAGSIMTLKEGTAHHSYHQPPITSEIFPGTPEEFMIRYDELTRAAFDQLLEAAAGRQLLIPLSGGIDSRFIVALLRDAGAPRVLCYTYGLPGASEPEVSRRVAERAGFDWLGIELDIPKMREQWCQPETASFLSDTWGAQGLPHIQDWYALRQLRANPKVDSDAIVLPGHTVVGNHHDDWAFERDLSTRETAEILARKHATLQGHPEYVLRAASPRAKLTEFIRSHPGSPARQFNAANLLGRQAKYITNSVHAYEHAGFSFALPLYDRPLWEHWLVAPPSIYESERKIYRAYVDRVFDERPEERDTEYFEAPMNRLPTPLATGLRRTVDMLGLKDRLADIYRALVEMRHPLGLHAFTADLSQPQIAKSLLSGTALLGLYTDLFLSGRWLGKDHSYQLWD